MENLREFIQKVKDHRSSMAYYKVVQLCESRVFTMCFRIIRNREEAEETAQDVFLSGFQKIDSLEDENKFLPWILKIAYHKSIDHVRKKKMKFMELSSEVVNRNPHINSDVREGENTLAKYLSVCDETEKAIIMLYYQEEMSTQEIAETLDLTKANVKIKLFRARNKIKSLIIEKRKII